jgi:hypothetical protein
MKTYTDEQLAELRRDWQLRGVKHAYTVAWVGMLPLALVTGLLWGFELAGFETLAIGALVYYFLLFNYAQHSA